MKGKLVVAMLAGARAIMLNGKLDDKSFEGMSYKDAAYLLTTAAVEMAKGEADE